MIPLMKHAFLEEFETRKALSEFINRADRFSMGEQCELFENKFSHYQGRKHSILFNSGGSANLALIQSLKNLGLLVEKEQIGFSALTWSTNVMPLFQLGLTPIPVDCSVRTLNVTSKTLMERLSNANLSALFITNALGFVGDLEQIAILCRERGILLIEDNCESLGTIHHQRKAGNFGLASTFSFFVAHHMSTIEGGMVCTDDQDLARMLKMVRANGWDRNLSAVEQQRIRAQHLVKSEFEAKYSFYDLGFNLRPTEITGFLGNYQLQFLDENIQKREANYLKFEEIMLRNHDFLALDHDHIETLSTFALPVVCANQELKNQYLSRFAGAGIEVRPMIAGNILRQPFFKKYSGVDFDLPGADFLHDCSFYCGNYPELTRSDIETIFGCLYQGGAC